MVVVTVIKHTSPCHDFRTLKRKHESQVYKSYKQFCRVFSVIINCSQGRDGRFLVL